MSDTSKDSSTATMASQLAPAEPRRALWGLLSRKQRWSLSWRGGMILALILASALLLVDALVLKGVYPFLATTHRVDTDVLVVEGWIHEYAIRAALKEFQSNHYARIFTTGGPVEGTGGYINDYCTWASVGADLLRKNGLANGSVQMVPSRVMDRDRTYGSAVALRNWFHDHNMPVRSVNVLTEHMHARRTRLLFQKALGKDIRVGIIDVVSEFAAYLYARLLFFPSEPAHPRSAARLSPVHD